MLAYAVTGRSAAAAYERRRCYQVVMKKCRVRLDGGGASCDDLGMTTTTIPTDRPLTHAERQALFSAARPEIVPNPTPARRLPPRSRRNSVKHRAYR